MQFREAKRRSVTFFFTVLHLVPTYNIEKTFVYAPCECNDVLQALDYTYWAYPSKSISNFTLHALLPFTLASKFYKWNDAWVTENSNTEVMVLELTIIFQAILRVHEGGLNNQFFRNATLEQVASSSIPENIECGLTCRLHKTILINYF